MEVPDYSQFNTVTPPTQEEFTQLGKLIKSLVSAENEVTQLEKYLKEAKARVREISQEKIPQYMRSIGVEEFTTSDGHKVRIRDDVDSKPLVANRPAVYQWLEENGHSGLIKTSVSVNFPRMSREQAVKLEQEMQERFPGSVSSQVKVEPQTLKKFVRESLKEGVTPPTDIFGISVYSETKLEKPKDDSVF